ncbi:MAG: hypothetical protein AB1725_08855 [Armatimonadota bacterium]
MSAEERERLLRRIVRASVLATSAIVSIMAIPILFKLSLQHVLSPLFPWLALGVFALCVIALLFIWQIYTVVSLTRCWCRSTVGVYGWTAQDRDRVLRASRFIGLPCDGADGVWEQRSVLLVPALEVISSESSPLAHGEDSEEQVPISRPITPAKLLANRNEEDEEDATSTELPSSLAVDVLVTARELTSAELLDEASFARGCVLWTIVLGLLLGAIGVVALVELAWIASVCAGLGLVVLLGIAYEVVRSWKRRLHLKSVVLVLYPGTEAISAHGRSFVRAGSVLAELSHGGELESFAGIPTPLEPPRLHLTHYEFRTDPWPFDKDTGVAP